MNSILRTPLVALLIGCSPAWEPPSPEPAPAACGNRMVERGEGCDDGNQDDGDSCTSNCVAAFCGDGFVQRSVEACDDANDDDTDACLSSCVAARCGDGFVREGVETCDDGSNNGGNGSGCTTDCTPVGAGIEGWVPATVVLDLGGEVRDPRRVIADDLDGDGSIDVLVDAGLRDRDRRHEHSVLRVLNDGTGTLHPPSGVFGTLVGLHQHLVLADLDEDGFDDLVVPAHSNAHLDSILVYRGSPWGLHEGVAIGTGSGAKSGPGHVLLEDLDHDGHVDVVALNNLTSAAVDVLLGDGTGSFTPVAHHEFPDPEGWYHLTRRPRLVSLHGGVPDLFTVDDYNKQLLRFRRTGPTAFSDGQALDLTTSTYAIAPFDLDQDGTVELLLQNDTSTLLVVDGDAGGAPVLQGTLDVPCCVGERAVAAEAADLDGDGLVDVLLACGVQIGVLIHTSTPGPRWPSTRARTLSTWWSPTTTATGSTTSSSPTTTATT